MGHSTMRPGLAVVWLVIGTSLHAAPAAHGAHPPAAIALPGGQLGIGFDDIGYSRTLGKVLVPAGRSGMLDLVDPATLKVMSIPGFSSTKEFDGGHDVGITSVAAGAGLLFVTDRTSGELCVVDPATKSIVGKTPLGASPDYVRWIESTHELWVTEPDSERIEVFHLEDGPEHRVTTSTSITVEGGPESLILDTKRGRAYTHVADGKTAAIDLSTRAIVTTWSNGCEEAKGIALDADRGFLFIACEAGEVRSLDAMTGKDLGSVQVGKGVDIISYSPELGHVYAPSGESGTLAILGVSRQGALSLLGNLPSSKDSHCVAVGGKVYVGDPEHGRLLAITDPYPRSAR